MGKRPKMRVPLPLSNLLQEEMKMRGLAERLREADIWRLWPEVVGQTVATRAQPLRIINGVLTVAVSSGPWMQELNFLKGVMREKLNEQLGGEVVKDIVLRSGKVVTNPAIPLEEPDLKKKKLNAKQRAFIEEQAAEISDMETREAFMALMKASLESVRS
ncbi:MAG TPA: DUF721 domain-containing protein [Desulfuromonadaceae bacterium]|jgi:hypothetical protein